MTKLEAIAFIDKALKHNPKFKKEFTDYIELSIIEELESNKINLPPKDEMKFVKDAANHILRLFDPAWFEFAFNDK